jgi:GAF domain-containing protein
MPNTLGARLRQHREGRAIALTTIAEQTKIKRSLLEALENDDVSHWPPGIFRRSWVRSYAVAIGLDPDDTVRDFLEQHPDPVTVDAAAAEATPPPASAAGMRGIINNWFQRRPAAPLGPPTAPPVAAVPSVAVVPSVVAAAPDLHALARICRELGRASSVKEIQSLLGEASGLLEAKGMIAWVWDHRVESLRPAFVHGYAPQFVARLPAVGRDDHNLTAAAFRLGVPQEAESPESSALVVPLLLAPRCAGVLAIEFHPGHVLTESIRAVASILGASVAQVVARAKAAQAQSRLAAAPRPQVTTHPVHPGPH